MITVVRFKGPDEFIAEVLSEAINVADGIVRMTRNIGPSRGEGHGDVRVIVTALITPVQLLPPFDRPVSPRLAVLDQFCGEVAMLSFDEDSPAIVAAECVMQKISAEVGERGLSVRPGIIEIPNQ